MSTKAVGTSPVAGVQGTDASASRVAMPPELRAELRRLWTKILVSDYLNDHERTDTPERTDRDDRAT